MFCSVRSSLARFLLLICVVSLAGCAIAPPRTDDPFEHFNRKAYAFNHKIDRAVIRPTAMAYRKVTTPGIRKHVNKFFDNLQLPAVVVNDLLQWQPKRAVQTSGRFLLNLTAGVLGFFDPATHIGMPADDNDFGVTLAHWGVPEGAYLVLPIFGPTTLRDLGELPVDSYLLDPLSLYASHHDFRYGQQYLPELFYLITLRSRAVDVESFLESAYDPYAFRRDTYRQQRLYKIYNGHPPLSAVEHLQGLDQDNFDPEQLLEQQRTWEKQHGASAPKGAETKPTSPPPTE